MGHGNPPAPTVWVEIGGRAVTVTVTTAPVPAGRTFAVRSGVGGTAHVIRLRPGLGAAAIPVLAEALSSIRWTASGATELDPATRAIRDEDAAVEHERAWLADQLAGRGDRALIVERLQHRLRDWQLSRAVEQRRLEDRAAPDPGLVLEPIADAAERAPEHDAGLARLAELLGVRMADPRVDFAGAAADLLRSPMFRHGSDGVARALLRVVGSELFGAPLVLPGPLDVARSDFVDWFAGQLPEPATTPEIAALRIGEAALVAAARAADVSIASRGAAPLGVEYQLVGDHGRAELTIGAAPMPDLVPYALGESTGSNAYTVRLNSRPTFTTVEDIARQAMAEVLRSAGLAADVAAEVATGVAAQVAAELDRELRQAADALRQVARDFRVPVEAEQWVHGYPLFSLAVEGPDRLDVLLTRGPLWRPGAVAVRADAGSSRYVVRLNAALTDPAARVAVLAEALTAVIEHAASGTGQPESILGRRPAHQPMLFRVSHFPVPQLRLTAPGDASEGATRWAEEQAAAASLELVALQEELTAAREPSEVATAFDRAYQRLAGAHEALAVEARHRRPGADPGPVAIYGLVPSDDPASPAAETRLLTDEFIHRRFAAALDGQRRLDEVTLQNLVTLPDGAQVEGTRLILGGIAAPRLSFVAAAAPDQRQRMHEAAIRLIADLYARSGTVDRTRFAEDFAQVAYLLYQSAPHGPATDAVRTFLVVTADFLFAAPLRLPHDVDVQAQTRPQVGTKRVPGFVERFARELPPPISS
jgi:hypothetical protein